MGGSLVNEYPVDGGGVVGVIGTPYGDRYVPAV